MQRSNIEWCEFTSNPVRGRCLHACPYCYAERIRIRFHQPSELSWHPDELLQIEKRKAPATIFIGSMYDVFGEWVPEEMIQMILDTAKNCPHHTFLFLTKNPKRYSDFYFTDNCWRGTTVVKANDFYATGWHSFVSFEPLINQMPTNMVISAQAVIVGAMTGPHSIKPKREWVDNIIKSSATEYLFLKNNLLSIFPDLLPIQETGWPLKRR